jgi:D-3-phosphoglycerate dehydrogenase
MTLLEKMGRLYTQLQPGPLKKIELTYSGEIASYDLRPLQAALIKGLLETISDAHVNMINAQVLAKERGLVIVEQKSTTPAEFANQVTLRVMGDSETSTTPTDDEHIDALTGTVMHDEPRLVRVGRYWSEFVPEGHILFCRNIDQPGMIGKVGTILGKAGVNIRHMDVGKPRSSGTQRPTAPALMVISVDNPIPQWALNEIRQTGDIFGVKVVSL